MESDWLSSQQGIRKDLEDLSSHLHVSGASGYLEQPSLPYTSGSTMNRAPSSFSVRLPQVQIEGPTFSGQEMENDRMSFYNFLSRFENCAAGMANDAEKLIFLNAPYPRDCCCLLITWVVSMQIICRHSQC